MKDDSEVQNKKEIMLPEMEETPIPKPKLEDGKLIHNFPWHNPILYIGSVILVLLFLTCNTSYRTNSHFAAFLSMIVLLEI